MKREEDLPCTTPDESLLGRHLLLAIYPSSGTLKMFEKDKVAVVCAHSALIFPLGFKPWRHTCGHHRWSLKEILKKLYTTVIHIARMPTQSSLSIMSKSPPVNSELVTVIICYLTHAVDVRGRAWKKGKHSGRLVPAGGKVSYLFRVFFTPLFSPRRGAPLLFNTQGLQTRTLWVCWSETLTHTHTRTHAGCVV